MFEIQKRETITSEVPVRHFQKGLEYESNQIHLWLLSHKESTAGFLVYFHHDNNLVIHIKPPGVDFGPEVRELATTEKAANEALFVAQNFRNMGGMKKLISELIDDAQTSNIQEIRFIDVSQDWLVEKLDKILKSSKYNQVIIVQPSEHEGGKSVVARPSPDATIKS